MCVHLIWFWFRPYKIHNTIFFSLILSQFLTLYQMQRFYIGDVNGMRRLKFDHACQLNIQTNLSPCWIRWRLWNMIQRHLTTNYCEIVTKDIFLNSFCALFEFFCKQIFKRRIIKLNTVFLSIHHSVSKLYLEFTTLYKMSEWRKKHKIECKDVEWKIQNPWSWDILETYLIRTIQWFRPLHNRNKTTIRKIMKVEQVYSLHEFFVRA